MKGIFPFKDGFGIIGLEANNLKCQIITVTPDILKKTKLINYNLNKYSIDTIKDFYNDAKAVGYKI